MKEEVKVSLADGSSTVISVYRCSDPDADVLIIGPALGIRASYYEPFAEALSASGINAVIMDLRGNGMSSVRPSRKVDFGYREMISLDYEGIITTTGHMFPGNRIFFCGHSLGGQLASLYASRNPGRVDGIILIGSCTTYFRGWKGLSGMRILASTQLIGAIASVLGYYPGQRIGFGGTEARSQMQDWSRLGRTNKFILNGDDFDYESALADLAIPILSISFEGDDLAPEGAVRLLLEKFSAGAHVTYHYLTRDHPSNRKYSHNNWVKKPDGIIGLITDWLKLHQLQ